MTPEEARKSVLTAYRGMGITEVKEHAAALALALASCDETMKSLHEAASEGVTVVNELRRQLRAIAWAIGGIGAALEAGRMDEVTSASADVMAVLTVHKFAPPRAQLPAFQPIETTWPDVFSPKGAHHE